MAARFSAAAPRRSTSSRACWLSERRWATSSLQGQIAKHTCKCVAPGGGSGGSRRSRGAPQAVVAALSLLALALGPGLLPLHILKIVVHVSHCTAGTAATAGIACR